MDALGTMRRSQLAFSRDRSLGHAALQLGGAAALAVLVWVAAQRWGLGATTILPMVALFARALPLLGTLQEAWLNWRFSRPALDATLALIDRAEAAREPDAASGYSPRLETAITLRSIAVTFAGNPILTDISLQIPALGICALTGPSGAGKSTLADLLGGLISPDSGSIALDDVRLTPKDLRAWRRRVAYVQQDPVLLSASVRENLAWGAPTADEAAMRQALADAAALFVDALPQGLDTQLGDGGRMLSGGERQRLVLARALLREPALLILDEASSALDSASEAEIAAAVTRLGQRMAVLVIGHRGALLGLAQRRFELDSGRLVTTDVVDRQA
jgi:ATP-binding cassette subfamily C protein